MAIRAYGCGDMDASRTEQSVSVSRMSLMKRKRKSFARQSEASILAACISESKRKKREADEESELAE